VRLQINELGCDRNGESVARARGYLEEGLARSCKRLEGE